MTVDCISRLSGSVRLALRYATADVHCKDRRYGWVGGIIGWRYWICRLYYNYIHCVSKKFPVTLSNLNQFSKLLHCWKANEISDKIHATLSASPQACCYTTLDNKNKSNYHNMNMYMILPDAWCCCELLPDQHTHRQCTANKIQSLTYNRIWNNIFLPREAAMLARS